MSSKTVLLRTIISAILADENELQLMEFCDDNSGDDKDYEVVQVAV